MEQFVVEHPILTTLIVFILVEGVVRVVHNLRAGRDTPDAPSLDGKKPS